MDIMKKAEYLPRQSVLLAIAEFVEATGVQPSRLEELLALDWIHPSRTEQNEYLFSQEDIYRVCKLERICCDFDIPVVGGIIIVDLLEHISDLEQRIEHLRQLNKF